MDREGLQQIHNRKLTDFSNPGMTKPAEKNGNPGQKRQSLSQDTKTGFTTTQFFQQPPDDELLCFVLSQKVSNY